MNTNVLKYSVVLKIFNSINTVPNLQLSSKKTNANYFLLKIGSLPKILKQKSLNWVYAYGGWCNKTQFTHYIVSDKGHVFNLRFKNFVMLGYTGNYNSVLLNNYSTKKRKLFYLGRLVLTLFKSPKEFITLTNNGQKPTVDHIDRNPKNDSSHNLQWVSYQGQAQNRKAKPNNQKQFDSTKYDYSNEEWRYFNLQTSNGEIKKDFYEISNKGRLRSKKIKTPKVGYLQKSACCFHFRFQLEGQRREMLLNAQRVVFAVWSNDSTFDLLNKNHQVVYKDGDFHNNNINNLIHKAPLKGEQWRLINKLQIKNHLIKSDFYEISNQGRIRSQLSLKAKRGVLQSDYFFFNLYVNNSKKVIQVAANRLVYLIWGNDSNFDLNCNNYQIHHKDNNPQNNCIENLEKVTRSQNCIYANQTRFTNLQKRKQYIVAQVSQLNQQNIDFKNCTLEIEELKKVTDLNETWSSLHHLNFSFYLVSNQGRVWSLVNKRFLSPKIRKNKKKSNQKFFILYNNQGKTQVYNIS